VKLNILTENSRQQRTLTRSTPNTSDRWVGTVCQVDRWWLDAAISQWLVF